MPKNNKKITTNELAIMMKRGFESVDKSTNKKIDDLAMMTDKKIDELAMMTKRGFDEMGERMNKGFSEVNKRLGLLEEGQEEIKLRLDNVAYRFELVELQRRVEVLEKKMGLKVKAAYGH